MKHSTTLAGLALALCLGLAAPAVTASPASQAALKARAKVTEADARATALAAVPGATVQSAELEIEHRKLVWSFDLKVPKSADVVELQVDARTGRIVSRKTETPADQAKEAAADKVKKQWSVPPWREVGRAPLLPR